MKKLLKESKEMKLKKLLVFVSALVLVFGLNATSVFAATGVWTIDGVADYVDGVNTVSTNNVSYFNSDSSNYCYTFWSQDGTDEVAQISQTVEITEAGTYTFSFQYMGGPEGNGPVSVVGFVGDETGDSSTTSGWIEDPALWDWYTMIVELEPGTYEVGAVVDLTSTNAWGDLDNFTLTDAAGTEYLVVGDFGFEDSEWSTYIVSNVQDVTSDATDDTEEVTEETTEEATDDTEEVTEYTTEADEVDDSSNSTVIVVIVIVVIIIIAIAAVLLSKKNKSAQ